MNYGRGEAFSDELGDDVDRRLRICETLMASTEDFIYLLDPSARFIYANRALLELWGRSLSEVEGKGFAELDYPPHLVEMHRSQVEEVVNTGESLRAANHYTDKSGETRYYEYVFSPVFDERGQVEAVTGITRDVTDRWRREIAEEARRESQRRLYRALNASKMVVWEWDVERKELTTFPDLGGQEDHPFPEGWDTDWADYAAIHPDDVEELRQLQQRALENEQTYRFEYRLRHPDHEEWLWMEDVGRGVRDAEGRRLLGVVRDITELRRTKRRLKDLAKQSERTSRMHEAILSTTPDLAYVYGTDLRVLYANDALLEVWGKKWNEVVGKRLVEFANDREGMRNFVRKLERAVETGELVRGEQSYRGASGERFYEYIVTPVFDDDGAVEAVAGTGRDVTEQKQAKEALKRTAEQKNRFLALLSHELRNPLVPIKLGLHSLEEAEPESERQKKAYETMERQVDQLNRLVDDLLDLTRISRDKIHLRCDEVELTGLIEETVDDYLPFLDIQEVDLELEAFDQLVYVDGDAQRLAQAVGNLLQNAAKFTEPGGHVRVWLEKGSEQEGVEIHVADDGIGMEPEVVSSLFQPFEQAESTLDRSTKGLGLGLALVKGVVELHGGDVEAYSEGPGEGSEFVIGLPATYRERPLEKAVEEVDEKEARRVEERRILVIEDNPTVAETLRLVLADEGHDVHVAHDGRVGVERARKLVPDVVICDLGLPEMDGFEVAETLRGEPEFEETTLVALSGYAAGRDIEKSREAGFDYHMAKPPDFDELVEILSRVGD